MNAPRLRLSPFVSLGALAAALAAAVPARADDFMDTRLTFTFGDDDVLHKTGQAVPLSPDASIGDRPQYRLFFDNLNSRFAGRENISHLVLYKKMPGYIEHLDTEAALVLRVDLAALASNTNNLNQSIYDAGTYLRLKYKTHDVEGHDREGIDLTMFPLDTDRFRLGYLYDISWGGTNPYINQSIFPRLQGSAPGAKLQYTGDGFYLFAGLKTAQIIQPEQELAPGSNDVETARIAQTNYGFLAGGGVDITKNLRIDAGTGYFQQGKFDLPDVEGKPIFTYGASGRVVVHDGMPVPQSIDFILYRNDPNAPLALFTRETYEPGRVAWAVSGELTQLEQNLKDFERPGATRLQAARAGALQLNVKAGYFRTSATAIYRDLPYVVRNQPSFIPFQTLPSDAVVKPETFYAFATDYYIESLHLRPGIGAGLQFPATFTSNETNLFGTISRTAVVRQQGNIAILPVGKGAQPITQARFSLTWELSDIMSAAGWVQVVHDNNGTLLERSADGTLTQREFISPTFLGFGTSVQARF